MSTEDQVTRLLDSALPDVPQAMLGAPIRTIHGLVRRRRRRIAAATTAAVAMLVVTAITAAFLVRPVHRGAPAVTPHPSPSVQFVPWQLVRVGRDGKQLTVYAQLPAGRCVGTLLPQIVQSATSVGIGLSPSHRDGADGGCDPDRAGALTTALTLDAPLRGRTVTDLAGNVTRRTYLDSELPEFPAGAGWHEVSGTLDLSRTVFLAVVFERGDGVDASITAADPSAVAGTKKGAVTLGRRTGQIYPAGTASYKVVWTVGDQQYSMQIDPNEGKKETLTAFKDLLATLRWAQDS